MSILRKLGATIGCGVMALFLAATATAQNLDDDEKAGTVVSVSPESNMLQVKLDEDKSTEYYYISDDTDVTVRGRSGDLEDLNSGDRIILDFEEEADRRRVARFVSQGENPADRRAEVLDVDTVNNELRVRFVDNNDSETFYIEPDTDIWVRGRAAVLDDVEDGDEVVLDFEERDNRRVLTWITYDYIPVATPSSRTVALNSLPDTASSVPLLALMSGLMFALGGLIRATRLRKQS